MHKFERDDLWRRHGYILMSRCWCYQQPQEETYEHIFMSSTDASKAWKVFIGAGGITVPLIKLRQVIRNWWNEKCCPKLEQLYQEEPTIITWELWKKRNIGRIGGIISTNKVIHESNKTLHYLAKVRYAWLSNIPSLWPEMIHFFKTYKPILITIRVTL